MADTGSMKGRVLNQQDGQPIAGAGVNLSGEGVQKDTTTGNDGRFLFDGLAPGKYEVVVRKEGFEDGIYGPLDVIDGITTEITVALQPSDIG